MKKVMIFFVILIFSVFLLNGCALFQTPPAASLPEPETKIATVVTYQVIDSDKYVTKEEYQLVLKELAKKNDFESINQSILSFNSRLISLESKINDLAVKSLELANRLDIMNVNISQNSFRDTINSIKDSYLIMERRINLLETFIFETKDASSDVNKDIADIYRRIEKNSTDTALLASKVAALVSAIPSETSKYQIQQSPAVNSFEDFKASTNKSIEDINTRYEELYVKMNLLEKTLLNLDAAFKNYNPEVPAPIIQYIEVPVEKDTQQQKSTLPPKVVLPDSLLRSLTSNVQPDSNSSGSYDRNNEIDALIESVNTINGKIIELENEIKKSNSYLLQNGNIAQMIRDEIAKIDFSPYVGETIDIQTEQAVSKLFYKSQSENILKVQNLEKNISELQSKYSSISNQFESILSKPVTNFDERMNTKVSELEKRVNIALMSLSDAELKEIFESTDQFVYTLKSGDTLSAISQTFGLGQNGVEILTAANKITNPNTLKVGQKIIIPVDSVEKYIKWPLKTTMPSNYERIVVKFGQRISVGTSTGIGILPLSNEKIYPILPGKVIDSGKSQNDTFYVKVDHGNSLVTVYSNLVSLSVSLSSMVTTDTSLGTVKKDKMVTIELWKSGEPKDPLKLFFKSLGTFMATFYTEWDDRLIYYPAFRLTKSGVVPTNFQTIAADPNVLPLGTVVYIPKYTDMPNNGFFVVEDTGGKIIGNRIDVYINDVRQA
ncbi:MAG TPA: 3D domain-containing protein, partial [Petrotogaceae bacterium]|nr:3D domain-containing protein [Petrotogaceae bacterium]